MKKYLIPLALLLILVACNQKQNKVIITQSNVKEALTTFGKDNPENGVVIETSFGTIILKLYDDTPLHRANFIKLIKEGHFTEGEFYRIVNEFMIQGGDLQQQLDYTIPAEFNSKYFHKKGALAMARSDDNNPNMESSSTEFYIMHGSRYSESQIDNDAANFNLSLTPEQRKTYITLGGDMSLDQKYTVFGEVTSGLDVVDKIANAKVYGEKPIKKISFKISVIENK